MSRKLLKDVILHGDASDILKTLPDESVQCCVTSPPYWGLRNYGPPGQIGLEKTIDEYTERMVAVFREVRRVLKKSGTLWLNLGDAYCAKKGQASSPDSYFGRKKRDRAVSRWGGGGSVVNGLKPKDLIGIPWRIAFALQADDWYLRQDIIWEKPNPMPESVSDRCTKAHEYMFLLSKGPRYHYDNDAIRERCVQDEIANGFRGGAYTNNETVNNSQGGKRKKKGNLKVPSYWDTDAGSHSTIHRKGRSGVSKPGYEERKWADRTDGSAGCRPPMTMKDREYHPLGRNKRSVWTVATQPYKEAHFATFPERLIIPCILAGCPQEGVVLDPFAGSGTTCAVAKKLCRHYIGIELNQDYIALIKKRMDDVGRLF